MCTQQRFQKSDLWWVLAFPLYELLTTARHEVSHALVALLEGAHIEKFVIFPSLVDGHFLAGYVLWSGSTDWVPIAAPYLGDLITYVLCFVLCTRLCFRRHWVWVNLLILGLLSPLVNSGYNYVVTPLLRPGTDVEWLLHALPPWAVHAYFCVTLTLYLLGVLAILIFPSHVLKGRTPPREQSTT
jgi:peptidase M50B-like protein